jgi:hypothetical protein
MERPFEAKSPYVMLTGRVHRDSPASGLLCRTSIEFFRDSLSRRHDSLAPKYPSLQIYMNSALAYTGAVLFFGGASYQERFAGELKPRRQEPMMERSWCRFRREARARERHRHTAVAESLKALGPERPIRETDMALKSARAVRDTTKLRTLPIDWHTFFGYIGVFWGVRVMHSRGGSTAIVLALLYAFHASPSVADPTIGRTLTVKTDANGVIGGESKNLTVGVDVFANERVVTDATGVATLIFLDNTKLTVGPISEVRLDKFVYDPAGSSGSVVLEFTKGAFRFITGSQDKSAYQIKTAFGSLGVRGTVVELTLNPCTAGVSRSACGVTLRLVEGSATFTTTNGQRIDMQPNTVVNVTGNGSFTKFNQLATILSFEAGAGPGNNSDNTQTSYSQPLIGPPPESFIPNLRTFSITLPGQDTTGLDTSVSPSNP